MKLISFGGYGHNKTENDVEEIKYEYLCYPYSSSSSGFVIKDEKVWCQVFFAH